MESWPQYFWQLFGINNTRYSNINKDNIHLVRDSLVTNIYAIDVEDPLYKRFEDSLTLGRLDKEKFQKGEEVILLIPIYNKGSMIEDVVEIPKKVIENTNQKNRMKKLLKNGNKFNLTYDFLGKTKSIIFISLEVPYNYINCSIHHNNYDILHAN